MSEKGIRDIFTEESLYTQAYCGLFGFDKGKVTIENQSRSVYSCLIL